MLKQYVNILKCLTFGILLLAISLVARPSQAATISVPVGNIEVGETFQVAINTESSDTINQILARLLFNPDVVRFHGPVKLGDFFAGLTPSTDYVRTGLTVTPDSYSEFFFFSADRSSAGSFLLFEFKAIAAGSADFLFGTSHLNSGITDPIVQTSGTVVTIVAPAPVPLPSSGLLLIAAFGGVLLSRRVR